MAEIFPFRAWRYDPKRVALEAVVTQPYDKITPEMQARYYAASPYNLVRIILGKTEPGDGAGHNVYTRARDAFREWREKNVLVQETKPSIYAYSQKFAEPETGKALERRGFITAGRIYDYAEGVVFRHEQTLNKPKADRLELLRATRAHFGQIFMLYSDPERKVDSLLDAKAGGASVTDEYGVTHSLRQTSDEDVIKAVQQEMAAKKLLIADGHHRYETALAYRNERCGEMRDHGACAGPVPATYECVMMTFVNMDSPGLVLLPTHRVVHGLGAERISALLEKAKQSFEMSKLEDGPTDAIMRELKTGGEKVTTLVVCTANGCWLLVARKDTIDRELNSLSTGQRALDVVVLHRLLLERGLGLSEESIRKQENVTYFRDAGDAIAQVKSGKADAAFLLNAARIEQVRDVAFAGEVMPQKSTDFYPKMLSGLTIYALE